MSNLLFLMMGGSGTRLGSPMPKQFIQFNGKPIFMYILDEYVKSGLIDRFLLICNSLWIDYVKDILDNGSYACRIDVISGGETRAHSIRNGIMHLKDCCNSKDCIFIHDATHPYLDLKSISNAIDLMSKYDGVTLCQSQYDTCYHIEGGVVMKELPKKNVVSGASPEIFRFGDLLKMFNQSDDETLIRMTSAGSLALEYGLKIGVVSTPVLNIKITYPEDLILFEQLCSTYFFKGEL